MDPITLNVTALVQGAAKAATDVVPDAYKGLSWQRGPRVSNDNPYSESLFRTVKYRPDYPRRPFRNQDEACRWACAFVDWYNHWHRHSAIRFVIPNQRHSGQAVELCRHRARVYEQARQRHPSRWSGSTRCWHQPDVVWINPPPPEDARDPVTLVMAA